MTIENQKTFMPFPMNVSQTMALDQVAHAIMFVFQAIFDVVARAGEAHEIWAAERRTVSSLASLNDRTLADIGIVRADIVQVARRAVGRSHS